MHPTESPMRQTIHQSVCHESGSEGCDIEIRLLSHSEIAHSYLQTWDPECAILNHLPLDLFTLCVVYLLETEDCDLFGRCMLSFVDGRQYGDELEYYQNGQLKSHKVYVNDRLHNVRTLWFDDGRLSYQDRYFKGKLHGQCKMWYKNGRRQKWASYCKGRLHGKFKTWHNNGKKWQQKAYLKSRPHGECKVWHSNEQLQIHAFYFHGNLHGEYKEWNEYGQLQKHAFYVHGKQKFSQPILQLVDKCLVWGFPTETTKANPRHISSSAALPK
jgi:antitoxin component YwqK of YwqJK toxin-antitoxin module